MAKRTNDPGPGDKAKVRVLFAEVEGNNESVQEALRTMVTAMSRPVRVITEQQANGKTTALLQGQIGGEEVEEVVETDEAETPDEEVSASTPRKRSSSGKRNRNAGLALVPNLDFRPDGKQPLKAFVEEKNPKHADETVLLSIYYMRHTMALPKISPNHVLTAFREVNQPVPVDLRQTIRNMKQQKIWVDFNDLEDISMTTQGDNYVEHDMGQSE